MSTALIAEDEPLLAAALRADLARLWPQLQVLAMAGDGPQALQQALALQPALCFLDIRMPGLTGLEVARALAEDWPDGPAAPPFPLLVFVTAYDQYALAAFDENLKPYYYSHMLAVEPDLQSAGIGAKLKQAQRDHALRTGVPLIKWTFDPLQSRNAYLNIIKLGGVIRSYKINYYGNASTSALHRGLDTDRLFVEWWVKSQRVAEAQKGLLPKRKPEAAIEVPRDIEIVKKQDLAEAQRWQAQVRSQFQKLLGEGLYCADFEADPNGNSRYLFFKDEHLEEQG